MDRQGHWDEYVRQLRAGQVNIRTLFMALEEELIELRNMMENFDDDMPVMEFLQESAFIIGRTANIIGMHAWSHLEEEVFELNGEESTELLELAGEV